MILIFRKLRIMRRFQRYIFYADPLYATQPFVRDQMTTTVKTIDRRRDGCIQQHLICFDRYNGPIESKIVIPGLPAQRCNAAAEMSRTECIDPGWNGRAM